MRGASPKLLVLIAATLTIALLAYVFAGESSPTDRPPSDRLTDEQARMPAPERALQPADNSVILPGSEETVQTAAPPPPPPSEPEVEPGLVTQPAPIVRPAPPEPPRRTAKAEVRQTAESRAPAKARADARPRTEIGKAKPRAVARSQRPAASPARTENAPAPMRAVTARPSYSCRYARTRSEIAVCSDAGLARLDQQMAAQFNTAYRQGTLAQRQVLERSRLRFLYRRDRCQSASCIAETYRARMSEITDIAARNWQEP